MEDCVKKLKRIVIKEELFSITNDTFEAIILGQMIYWQERVNDFDKFIKEEKERSQQNGTDININNLNGWIYKKANELSNECMLNLSDVSIRRYLNKLIDKKFIFCRTNPLYKWDKTLQYRTNLKLIIDSIKKNGYDGLGGYSLSKENNKDTKLQNECSEIQNEAALPEITNRDYKHNKEDTIVSKKEKYSSITDGTDLNANVDTLYGLYPSKCPKRNVSLGKCFKDKDRLRKLLKSHSFEMLKFTIEREIKEKYNKSYMSNFSTFLNNLPDYGYNADTPNNNDSKNTNVESEDNLVLNGITYK